MPPEAEPAKPQLTVRALPSAAADRTMAYRLVEKDGAFEGHVPPGSYQLLAEAPDWFGRARHVEVRADSWHDVLIALEPAARITGAVIGLPSELASMPTLHVEGPAVMSIVRLDQGGFTIDGLVADEVYQLKLPGFVIETPNQGMVRAPNDGLSVRIRPGPVFRGAMGRASGNLCPLETVAVYKADDSPYREPLVSLVIDPNCKFETDQLEPGMLARLIASGGGWHFDVPFTVPSSGDPEEICLNPPCS